MHVKGFYFFLEAFLTLVLALLLLTIPFPQENKGLDTLFIQAKENDLFTIWGAQKNIEVIEVNEAWEDVQHAFPLHEKALEWNGQLKETQGPKQGKAVAQERTLYLKGAKIQVRLTIYEKEP